MITKVEQRTERHICTRTIPREGDILRINSPLLGVLDDVVGDVGNFFDRLRVLCFRRKRIAHRNDDGSRERSNCARDAIVGIDIADQPAATVNINNQGASRFVIFFFRGLGDVAAHRDTPVTRRDHSIFRAFHMRTALVPETAFTAIGLSHLFNALIGRVRVFCQLVLLGNDCAHLLAPHAGNIKFVCHYVLLPQYVVFRPRRSSSREYESRQPERSHKLLPEGLRRQGS